MYTAKGDIALNCVFGWLPPALSRSATQPPEAQNEILAQMDPRVGKRRALSNVQSPGASRRSFRLGNSQDERVAGSTAATAQISRVPAGSVDHHTGGSRRGYHSGSNRHLQLRTARDHGVQIGSVDDHNRRRNKFGAIHIENKALLHFSQRNRAGGKGSNDRGWPSASAQRIERVAALEDQRGEQ
jgi:hypothetical protein